jgi:hypothetical protein
MEPIRTGGQNDRPAGTLTFYPEAPSAPYLMPLNLTGIGSKFYDTTKFISIRPQIEYHA